MMGFIFSSYPQFTSHIVNIFRMDILFIYKSEIGIRKKMD